MKKGLLDALYWRLHTSYLNNERNEAKKFLGMIKDEISKGGSLAGEIGPHFSRFKKIDEQITTGNFGNLHGGYSTPYMLQSSALEKSGAEKAFHEIVLNEKSKNILFPLLDVPKNAIITHEVELGTYGRCDFFIRFGRKLMVVEIKMGEAPIYVSSQIEKYRIAAELEMCLGLYDEVEACVMAEDFPQYIASQLSSSGIIMIRHYGTDEKFERLRVNNA